MGSVDCAPVTEGDDGAEGAADRGPRRWASTEDVARAAGRSAVQVRKWSQMGLLPPYTTVNLGRGGRHARWPLEAVEQARRVAELFSQALTLDEIRAELATESSSGATRGRRNEKG